MFRSSMPLTVAEGLPWLAVHDLQIPVNHIKFLNRHDNHQI